MSWREERAKPATELEWMMQNEGNVPSMIGIHNEAVQDYIESLDESDRELIEAYFYERLSYAQLGKRLGTNNANAWRRMRKLLDGMKDAMAEDPVIAERYHL